MAKQIFAAENSFRRMVFNLACTLLGLLIITIGGFLLLRVATAPTLLEASNSIMEALEAAESTGSIGRAGATPVGVVHVQSVSPASGQEPSGRDLEAQDPPAFALPAAVPERQGSLLLTDPAGPETASLAASERRLYRAAILDGDLIEWLLSWDAVLHDPPDAVPAHRPKSASRGTGPDSGPARLCARMAGWDGLELDILIDIAGQIDCVFVTSGHVEASGAVAKADAFFFDQILEYTSRPDLSVDLVPVIDNFDPLTGSHVDLAPVLANEAKREALSESMAAEAERTDARAVALELVDLSAETVPELPAFIAELQEKIDRIRDRELVVAVPLDLDHPGLDAALEGADVVLLVAHGMHGFDTRPGPIATLDWISAHLDRWRATIPAEDLIVELASYGFAWENGDEPPVQIAIDDVLDRLRSAGAQQAFDPETGSGRLAALGGAETWFQSATTLYNQVFLLRQKGIEAISIDRVGTADPAVWSLFEAGPIGYWPSSRGLTALRFTNPASTVGTGAIQRISGEVTVGSRDVSLDPETGFVKAEVIDEFPTRRMLQRWGGVNDKKLVLTFDDGPHPLFTRSILDVLGEYDVPAAFFVTGRSALQSPDVVREILDRGHEIGNHTFTHPDVRDISPAQFQIELNATQRVLESITDTNTVYFRFPFNAAKSLNLNQQLEHMAVASAQGYFTIDMPVDSMDWQNPGVATIVRHVVEGVRRGEGNVILFHDNGLDRTQTIQALPFVIKILRNEGYSFVHLSDLVSLHRSLFMPPIAKADAVLGKVQAAGFAALSYMLAGLPILFYACILLGLGRIGLVTALAALSRRPPHMDRADQPLVSVIVPAFNEAKVITRTIDALLASTHPFLEIVVVDDGSTDDTAEVLLARFADDPRVVLLTKPNGGKASALNYGMERCCGEYVVALDADTIFRPDTISTLVRNFADPAVAAVAGNAKVGNRINALTRIQASEYITTQNLDRRAFETINAIPVVPGAVGAWRRDAILAVGGYREDTLAEDADLTLTLLRRGYRILYEPDAIAFTEAPDDIRGFARQRFRWTFGTLQNIWKHKSAVLCRDNVGVGLIVIPQMVLFQFVLPLFAPIVDILFVAILGETLFSLVVTPDQPIPPEAVAVLMAFTAFVVLDTTAAAVAFMGEPKEDKSLLLWIPVQRFFYRQLLYFVVFRAIARAVSGTVAGWGKLERKNTVAAPEVG